MKTKIFIGADHGGYELKNKIIDWLKTDGTEVVDMGNDKLDLIDDYPDFAHKVAAEVSKDSQSRGILICRNGVGMCITANRYKNVRAVVTDDEKVVKSARNDDDVNVLCLGGDIVNFEKVIKLITIFLNTDLNPDPRFLRRIEKIET